MISSSPTAVPNVPLGFLQNSSLWLGLLCPSARIPSVSSGQEALRTAVHAEDLLGDRCQGLAASTEKQETPAC